MSRGRKEQFVSEQMLPVAGTGNVRRMAVGEPGLPKRFRWRGQEYVVARVLATWKVSTPEGHKAGGEMYLRRHYYRIQTEQGAVLTVYCERQSRSPRRPKARWWVYTVEEAAGDHGP
jgi:phosphoribosylglycinamide formyltransferase-1